MISTFATSLTLAQTEVLKLFRRLIEGDMIAIAVTGGIVAVIVISFITWKLMQPRKPEEKSDDPPNLKL